MFLIAKSIDFVAGVCSRGNTEAERLIVFEYKLYL